MKKYEVNFNLWIEYSTTIEADTEEEAIEKAWDILQSTTISQTSDYNYDYDIKEIEITPNN